MKLLITGACGQLGSDVVERALLLNHEVIATGLEEKYPFSHPPIKYVKLDITDENAVNEAVEKIRPDAIIHCAAWTAVDAAEKEENRDLVRRINRDGTLNLAKACKAVGAKMMYISTDYVFNGNRGGALWDPDCKEFGPINFYGKTKLEGEFAVKETLDNYFIVRISWVYGRNGNNFVKTMLKLAKTHDTLTVVDDQIGRTTNTYDLAKLLCEMIVSDKYGTYNATNEGSFTSWADFAKAIFEIAGKDVKVIPVTTEEYYKGKVIAPRPLNSRMDTSKIAKNGFTPLPDWRESLKEFIKNLG